MTLRIKKDEFQLLMDILGEGLQTISLKKLHKQPIPNSYATDKANVLFEKLINQAETQNVELNLTELKDNEKLLLNNIKSAFPNIEDILF